MSDITHDDDGVPMDGSVEDAVEEPDLELNTVDRFAKRSTNLVLEEHGHCEVPAGCGGVVLRWRNPNAGVPVFLRVALAEPTSFFLDGERLLDSRFLLEAGRHVLALHITRKPAEIDALALAVTADTARPLRMAAYEGVSSSAVSQWRMSLADPGDGWVAREFDDRAWTPMALSGQAAESLPDPWRWRFQSVARYEAALLELPRLANPREPQQIWIRFTFRVSGEDVDIAGLLE